MQFCRNIQSVKCLEKQQGVLYRYSIIRCCMPQESRRGILRNIIFQGQESAFLFICIILSQNAFKRTLMCFLARSDYRIAEHKPIGAKLFGVHAQSFCNKGLVPEYTKACRQMSTSRRTLDYDLLCINMPFFCIFTEHCNCCSQLKKRLRETCRSNAVAQNRSMIAHCHKSDCKSFCLSVRSHLIAAARTDQHNRSFSLRIDFR